jgi:hypothetical protein
MFFNGLKSQRKPVMDDAELRGMIGAILDWGTGGRGFKSRRSDQKSAM